MYQEDCDSEPLISNRQSFGVTLCQVFLGRKRGRDRKLVEGVCKQQRLVLVSSCNGKFMLYK